MPTSFFFEKSNKARSVLRISFQSSLLKDAHEGFFLCNADIVKFRNASEFS